MTPFGGAALSEPSQLMLSFFALLLFAAAGWLLGGTLPGALRMGATIASLAAGALAAALLAPPIAMAASLAILAPALRARVPGMLGALATATVAVLAGAMDASLGIAALAAAFWHGSETPVEQAMLAVAAIALAVMPLDGLRVGLRVLAILAALLLAILARRPVRHVALAPGGQRAIAQLAALAPAAAVAGLVLTGQGGGAAASDLPRALVLLVIALAGAAAVAAALLGLAILFATRNHARAVAAGGLCAAAVGVPLLGPRAGLLLIVPFAISLAIVARSRLLRGFPWRQDASFQG